MEQNIIQNIQFLLAPLAICIILVGIHCYLGLHVLARGVIFVDLSLAQVAALGATIGIFFGYEHHSLQAHFISIFCTFIAAGLFAFARKHERTFPQEALIGIVYALASALVVLVVDKTPHGMEHIKEILVGQLLWVTWSDVLKTFLIYSGVAVVHYLYRHPLIESSFHHKGSVIWDFIFYMLFGIVIASSVKVAGVLLVFSFLIVPSLISSIYCKTIRSKLVLGWILGTILSMIGLALSFAYDFPAGACIVVCFTITPILALILRIRGTS
jgi:zinc/manganese transport system permease protein